MSDPLYPAPSRDFQRRAKGSPPKSTMPSRRSAKRCSPRARLPAKTKQLIAVAVAHVTQCPYCIKGTPSSPRQGAARRRS